jgi:amyloid beta precursor protein binding protein 1
MATNNKYDRQLRLWGANGQQALGDTTVLLIRASAAGTETLKNLVLPGVGNVVVVDDVMVTEDDAASNFFVTFDAASPKPRAEVALELLQELNPDVQGSCQHVESLQTVNYEELLAKYAANTTKLLVVCADLEPTLLLEIAAKCAACNTVMLQVQSYGLIGLVRIQSPPMAIFDPKPSSSTPDLRLVTPFPTLVEYCNSIQLESLADHEHSHVPYPVILYQLAQQYKAEHNGQLPITFQEKQDFRTYIKDNSRKWDQEVNYHEAQNNAYLAYTEKTVDTSHVEALLQLASSKPTIVTLLNALLQFLTAHNGQAPLHGTLPDMTASTASYVHLQQLYHDQAQRDFAEIASYCTSISIPEEVIRGFCANVFDLDVMVIRTLEEEYNDSALPEDVFEDLQSTTWDPYEIPEQTPLLWYIGLRACHLFHIEKQRYPGNTTTDDDWEQDIDLLHQIIQQVCIDLQLHECDLITSTLLANDKKFASELARYANAEIHTIASVVGGVASQEAVKLITGQYVPLNNTYIYNGIASVGGVYQF